MNSIRAPTRLFCASLLMSKSMYVSISLFPIYLHFPYAVSPQPSLVVESFLFV